MPLTAETLVELARSVETHVRVGCVILRPPVEVIEKETGDLLHVGEVDLEGKYRGTVRFIERPYWWDLDNFELKT